MIITIYLKLNHRPWQQYHALWSEPCMGYLSWGDEFQAFWYEKACQIKTGQNIYIELCTLHGNHNSYAETRSINACFPQLLVCVCVCVLHTHTPWPKHTEALYYWTDSEQAWQEYQMHTECIFLFVYRLYIGLKISPEKEEHDAAASRFLDVTVIHIHKSKTLHCLVVSGSCTKFCFVEKNKR